MHCGRDICCRPPIRWSFLSQPQPLPSSPQDRLSTTQQLPAMLDSMTTSPLTQVPFPPPPPPSPRPDLLSSISLFDAQQESMQKATTLPSLPPAPGLLSRISWIAPRLIIEESNSQRKLLLPLQPQPRNRRGLPSLSRPC
jgi:hypothetical protein